MWHAGLGRLVSLPTKVCKGNFLPAEEWAYSKTRRYLEGWICYQKYPKTKLETEKCRLSSTISCTKLVVPLWRLTSNNVQYPLSFFYLQRFRGRTLRPPKKTSSIWTSEQYVERWFGSVQIQKYTSRTKRWCQWLPFRWFHSMFDKESSPPNHQTLQCRQRFRPSCRRVLKERCYWQGCPWSFAETTSYAGLLRGRRRNMFVVVFWHVVFSQEQDRRQ